MQSTSNKLWKQIGTDNFQSKANSVIRLIKCEQEQKDVLFQIQQKTNQNYQFEQECSFDKLDLSEIKHTIPNYQIIPNNLNSRADSFLTLLSADEGKDKNDMVKEKLNIEKREAKKCKIVKKLKESVRQAGKQLANFKEHMQKLQKQFQKQMSTVSDNSQRIILQLFSSFSEKLQSIKKQRDQQQKIIQNLKQQQLKNIEAIEKGQQVIEQLQKSYEQSLKTMAEMKTKGEENYLENIKNSNDEVIKENNILRKYLHEKQAEIESLQRELANKQIQVSKLTYLNINKNHQLQPDDTLTFPNQNKESISRASYTDTKTTVSDRIKCPEEPFLIPFEQISKNLKEKQKKWPNSCNRGLKQSKNMQQDSKQTNPYFLQFRQKTINLKQNESAEAKRNLDFKNNANKYSNFKDEEKKKIKLFCSSSETLKKRYSSCSSQTKSRYSQNVEVNALQQKILNMKSTISMQIKDLKRRVSSQFS